MQYAIDRLTDNLLDKVDAAIILSSSNKSYLLSALCDDAGCLVITKNKAYYIIDSRYFEVAQRLESDKIKIILQDKLFEQISEIFKRDGCKEVCLETSFVSVEDFKLYKQKLKDFEINPAIDASKYICDLRKIKSDFEIKKIKKAQEITDNAFTHILSSIKVGKTEKELALELEFYMRLHGARSSSFDIIFVAGKNSSLPHGCPSDYKLQNSDLITIDFGADFEGYKSDMTRTVALGSVSDEQKQVYETVLLAQRAALKEIKAGECCSKIDSIARNVISDRGYGQYFGHALGHSVGIDIHESPNFSPKCDEILKPGMVLTVEPGIYLPGKFGVRIEDMVVITEFGAENITKSDKSLIIL